MLDEESLSWIYAHWLSRLGLNRHDLCLQSHLARAHRDHRDHLVRHGNRREWELRLWECLKGQDVSCPFCV